MTEDDAKDWLRAQQWWDSAAGERLRHFVELVLEEADRQNLISSSSRGHIWARHIVDSAQLVPLAEDALANEGLWVDLGTGAGFPGLVVACLIDSPVLLIEVRPLRVAFLNRAVEALGLSHVTVECAKVEKVILPKPAAVMSARAYAPLDNLLAGAHHLSDENSVWILPKGRKGEMELDIVRRDWQAVFHVEQSLTDPDSVIVTAQGLKRRWAPPPTRKTQNLRKNWRKS